MEWLHHPSPARPAAQTHHAGLRELRRDLLQLAALASEGTPWPQLARLLGIVWRTMPPREHDDAAQRRALAVELVRGVARMARWRDGSRAAQVLPPLCVALQRADAPQPLRVDLCIPDDGRAAAAERWADDIALLMRAARIPHEAHRVVVPGGTTAADAPRADAGSYAWGCLSLFQQYAALAPGALRANRVPLAA